MVFRRKGRPTWYFQAKTATGWVQLSTLTPAKPLGQRIEGMWEVIATEHRAWDVLDRVLTGELPIGRLYDLWTATKNDIGEVRRRLSDVDVEKLVQPWHEWLSSQRGKDWADHALTHVRRILPEGTPKLASSITDDWLTGQLAAIRLKRNTRRKIHSSWSSCLGYCTKVGKAFPRNPMDDVDRPSRELLPPTFYDGVTAERIVDWQPTKERRAFFALIYGTPADVSPAISIDRADINPTTREVRIAGTKTKTRDRIVRVADWAWPTFWAYAKTVLHGRVFPKEWNRWTVSDWHRQTVGEGTKDTHGKVEHEGLRLGRRLPLRRSRHHWAVRMLAAGVPARVVADQLGSDEKTVMDYYGPWVPSGADRDKWEKVATKHETKRRSAKDSANGDNVKLSNSRGGT